LVTTLCLLASSATAGDCKKIIAGVGVGSMVSSPGDQHSCSYEGTDYIWCFEFPVTGNLRGTWYFYGYPAANGFFDPTVLDDDLGIPGWDLWVIYSLSVFETHKGDIVTQESEILSLDAYFTHGAFSSTASIIGGTDDYEEASGWLGFVGTEADGGVLRGMICIP
jgi:hypothetical protein